MVKQVKKQDKVMYQTITKVERVRDRRMKNKREEREHGEDVITSLRHSMGPWWESLVADNFTL